MRLPALKIPYWAKPAAWGVTVGAIGMTVVGFSLMGWTTAGSAQAVAQERASVAVASALVPFCLAKAQLPSAVVNLRKFQDSSSNWSQDDIVRTSGWPTLEGMTVPDNALSRACSERLRALKVG